MNWRHMRDGDIQDVCAIADICHPSFPEKMEVLAEKRILSPDTCFVLETNNGVGGYLIAHPYLLGHAPALDCLLGALPVEADMLYLHDLAIAPHARSSGQAAKAVMRLVDYAMNNKIQYLSLIAVNGSVPFWQKYGFTGIVASQALQQKLSTYSDDALYMTNKLS